MVGYGSGQSPLSCTVFGKEIPAAVPLLALIVLVAALLSACGGEDRAGVDRVFDRLAEVQRTGDAVAACEEVYLVQESHAAAEDDEEEEREREREEGGEPGESPEECRAAFQAAAATRRDQVQSLRSTVQSVTFDGDTAVAKVQSEVTRADGSTFINIYERDLVRRDGDWRIRISPEG